MNEKLTQAEIDALISSFQKGGEEAVVNFQSRISQNDEYRPYDFNRPEKFSIENLQSLERIASTFAKSLSRTLTAKLRSAFSVAFLGTEQVPFISDYADIMTKDYYAFCVTDMGNPDLNEIVVELDLAFIMAAHKKWLGNELPKNLNERRILTDIEQLTAVRILESVVYENLELAFDSVTEVNPTFVSLQTDSQLLKVTSGTDMVAVVNLAISCEYWNTTLRLIIPFESVEAIIDKMTVENILEFSPNKKKKSYREEIEKGLQNVMEEIYVSVGETNITLQELSEIEVGDVLKFDNKVTEPVKGFAAGVHKFHCLIGKEHKRKAFRFLNFTETTDTTTKE